MTDGVTDQETDTERTPTKCGYVALLGAPNAGKSTLLNRLIGQKVSIVSPKVQTTRARVLGIQVKDGAQIIYVDTPGIFRPKRRLDRAMVAAAWTGAADADQVVLLVDVVDGVTDEVREIIAELARRPQNIVLALNKVDAIKRERLLALTAELDGLAKFERVFMISALNGSGVEDLESFVIERLRPGHWLYPEDQLSTIPQRLLAAEITREQLYLQLHDELPYETTVETESWKDFDNGEVRIDQVIYVQRATQKAIVLGNGGKRIKTIGERSRKELTALLERKVHLFLFVKVRENWADDRERYDAMGLDFQ